MDRHNFQRTPLPRLSGVGKSSIRSLVGLFARAKPLCVLLIMVVVETLGANSVFAQTSTIDASKQ
jgi:hypothetical protein